MRLARRRHLLHHHRGGKALDELSYSGPCLAHAAVSLPNGLGSLILHEVLRLRNFPDVVIVRPDAGEQCVGSDRARSGLGEVGDGNCVGVRPWRLETQALHQRPIEVRPLEQCQIGLDPGEQLRHR